MKRLPPSDATKMFGMAVGENSVRDRRVAAGLDADSALFFVARRASELLIQQTDSGGRGMTVARTCTRCVDFAEGNECATAVAQRMRARNVGTLIIVDHESRWPTGLVTDRDLVVRVLSEQRDPNQTRITEVMTQFPQTVTEETPIEEALHIMRCGPYRRLPVVNRDGRLVGILSLDDVLRLLTEEFGDISRLLREESPTALGCESQ
jgi:CBS domain-containing protein